MPLAGFDGVVRGLQGRDIAGKCPARWVSLANVGGRTWAKYGYLSGGSGYDTVIVTEGPGDALTALGVGYDVVMIRGASMARNAALVQELADGLRGRDVVVAGDPDNAGSGFTGGRTGEGRTGRPTAVLPARRRGRHSLARARRGSLPCSVPSCGEDAEDVTVNAPAPAPQPSTEPAVPDDADAAMARMDMSARLFPSCPALVTQAVSFGM